MCFVHVWLHCWYIVWTFKWFSSKRCVVKHYVLCMFVCGLCDALFWVHIWYYQCSCEIQPLTNNGTHNGTQPLTDAWICCANTFVFETCAWVCVCLCVCLYWLSCVCNHKPTFHVIWSQFDIDWHDTSVRYKPTPFPICSALLYSALFLLCSALPISNRHGTRGPYIHICICNILGWFAMHGWIGTPNKNHPQSYQNVLQHTFGVY